MCRSENESSEYTYQCEEARDKNKEITGRKYGKVDR